MKPKPAKFHVDRKRLGTGKALAIYSAARRRSETLKAAAQRAAMLAPWAKPATPQTRLRAATATLLGYGVLCALGVAAIHYATGGASDLVAVQLGATFTLVLTILSFANNGTD